MEIVNKIFKLKILKKILHKKPIKCTLFRNRHYWKNMECIDLNPPASIRGMTTLDRDLIQKKIKIPKLKIPQEKSNEVISLLKKFLLKMENLKPVNIKEPNLRVINLHPMAIGSFHDLPKIKLQKFDVDENNFYYANVTLKYENWRADELLKFILPADQESLTSYSRIGHICHVNLRDHLLPYKSIIGEVLLDKIVGCKTVVSKVNIIENTYRNFQFELLSGEPNYIVETKENGIIFEFDFSKVYWNPRLSTEHERVIKIINPNDQVYDVFAGVGPFSVPAAKKLKCNVLANDLNPASYKWLNHNSKRNKCDNFIRTFNKDGRDFVIENIKVDLKDKLLNNFKNYIHIIMNLPAVAIEFLDAFSGLFTEDELDNKSFINLPIVHVYCFKRDDESIESIKNLIEMKVNAKLNDKDFLEIVFVRNVAPNKNMFRISFYLINEILCKRNLKRSLDDVEENSNCNKVKIL